MMQDTPRYSGMKIGPVLVEQGRRQDWLAEQVGVTPATVNRWIRGSRSISRESAIHVAFVLGVSFGRLFTDPIGSVMDPEGLVA